MWNKEGGLSMNAKKLTVSIFAIIFIVFAAISTIVYDNSNDVGIICYEDSYAEEYAKKHDIDYENGISEE